MSLRDDILVIQWINRIDYMLYNAITSISFVCKRVGVFHSKRDKYVKVVTEDLEILIPKNHLNEFDIIIPGSINNRFHDVISMHVEISRDVMVFSFTTE